MRAHRLFQGFALAIALALVFVSGTTESAEAHSLPGTTLTFSHGDRQLNLKISLPVEDLVLAAPALQDLNAVNESEALGEDELARLASYLEHHLRVENKAQRLLFQLETASVEARDDKHSGVFLMLILTLRSPLFSIEDQLSLTLKYDAVMHEVRNHRAKVYWDRDGRDLMRVADFGFNTSGGKDGIEINLEP